MSAMLLVLIVAVDGTAVSAGPGARPLVTVAAGTELEERGEPRGGHVPVTLSGAVQLEGWVRRDRLGCRTSADVELVPGRRSPAAKLRQGALLRPRATRGEMLEVESTGPLVVRGTIPARACVSPGRVRADETPVEGTLALVVRETDLLDGPEGAVKLRLPAGTRFNARERHQAWAGGRTDGAVVIAGWVRAQDLGGPPVGSPIDVLTRPLAHTHEVLAPAPLYASRTGRRPTAVTLGGGAPITVIEAGEGRTRVRTVGPITAEGWVSSDLVRELSTSEDSITLPPGAARRSPPPRGPRLRVP